MNTLEIILCAIGVYNVFIGFMMETENILSTLLLKIVPLFSGLFVIGYALLMSGFIKIG